MKISHEQFLEQFKEKVKDEVSKLNYKKYFFQFNESEKTYLIKELKEIETFFKTELNIDVYPVYGTLLGMTRDNDLIPWDTDIDLAYLSNYKTNEEVLIEFNKICDLLTTRGLMLKRIKTASHLHIYSPNKGLKIDLWISWIDKDNNYHLVWSVLGDLKASMILPFKEIVFKGYSFKLINDPILFLNEHYLGWNSEYIDGYQENWAKRKPRFELEQWRGA